MQVSVVSLDVDGDVFEVFHVGAWSLLESLCAKFNQRQDFAIGIFIFLQSRRLEDSRAFGSVE